MISLRKRYDHLIQTAVHSGAFLFKGMDKLFLIYILSCGKTSRALIHLSRKYKCMTKNPALGNRDKVLREYPNTSASLWKVEQSKESHACVAHDNSKKGKDGIFVI